jgi:hypothetical protein
VKYLPSRDLNSLRLQQFSNDRYLIALGNEMARKCSTHAGDEEFESGKLKGRNQLGV